jgi:hypothetical protein
MSSIAPTPPMSAAPVDVLARLRSTVPRAIAPAFEQALLKTELWLSELSAEQARKGEADSHSADSQSLRAGAQAAVARCRESLTLAIEAITHPQTQASSSPMLSLIEDEQMEMQLAGERLIEKLSHFHRIGLQALDARLHAVFGNGPYGKRLPMSPQVIADAAREGLGSLTLTEEFKVLAFRHFEALVDPVLSDMLKEFNAGLAGGGILPDLVVQDEEERRRRETLRTTSSAAPPRDEPAKDKAAAGDGGGSAVSPTARAVSPVDQMLVNNLIELVRAAQLSRGPVYSGPQRPIVRSEALTVLDTMQRVDNESLLAAFAQPNVSIAEVIKAQMTDKAQRLGMAANEERVALPDAEDTAVELAGQMFEVMLRNRPYGDVVAPLLARMVLPFMRAAVIEPALFTQPEHPARQLLNTVSEACEENSGETPQEKELLAEVDNTIKELNENLEEDLDFFGQLEKKLAAKLQPHRKRAEIAEKRASETQRGQERLEVARRKADETVEEVTAEREMPTPLETYLTEQWKHHLSITALRQGTESEAWAAAQKAGKPWLDLLDMADLGEPLPMQRLSSLKEITTAVLETSGIHGKDAESLFNNILVALNIWSRENTEDVSSAAKSIREEFVPPKPVPMLKAAKEKAAAANSPDAAPGAAPEVTVVAPRDLGPPPTEEELAEVRALTVGTWLQLPKEPDGTQQLKVSWISGISGLIMLCNRKGARIMAVTPPELVAMRRKNAMMVFQRAAPVDQAMEQLFEKLRHTAKPH